MNIKEFIKYGGHVRSKSGHDFVLTEFNDSDYPIIGYLVMREYDFPCRWTEDGIPDNLPTNHGLDLMPLARVVSYRMVDKESLKNFNTLMEFSSFYE